MTETRPRCSVCFEQPREPNSRRCIHCGPGRIITPACLPPEPGHAPCMTTPQDPQLNTEHNTNR